MLVLALLALLPRLLPLLRVRVRVPPLLLPPPVVPRLPPRPPAPPLLLLAAEPPSHLPAAEGLGRAAIATTTPPDAIPWGFVTAACSSMISITRLQAYAFLCFPWIMIHLFVFWFGYVS